MLVKILKVFSVCIALTLCKTKHLYVWWVANYRAIFPNAKRQRNPITQVAISNKKTSTKRCTDVMPRNLGELWRGAPDEVTEAG